MVHINSKHKEIPTVYACKICGMEFLSASSRIGHEVKIHNKKRSKREVRCNFCNDCFETSQARLEHTEQIHPDLGNKYKCDLCPKWKKLKGFRLQSRLEVHKTVVHMVKSRGILIT